MISSSVSDGRKNRRVKDDIGFFFRFQWMKLLSIWQAVAFTCAHKGLYFGCRDRLNCLVLDIGQEEAHIEMLMDDSADFAPNRLLVIITHVQVIDRAEGLYLKIDAIGTGITVDLATGEQSRPKDSSKGMGGLYTFEGNKLHAPSGFKLDYYGKDMQIDWAVYFEQAKIPVAHQVMEALAGPTSLAVLYQNFLKEEGSRRVGPGKYGGFLSNVSDVSLEVEVFTDLEHLSLAITHNFKTIVFPQLSFTVISEGFEVGPRSVVDFIKKHLSGDHEHLFNDQCLCGKAMSRNRISFLGSDLARLH